MTPIGHGQIWWADFDDGKIQPVPVLTRAWVAPRLSRVLIAPITTRIRDIPAEVPVGFLEGLAANSVVNLDNIELVERDRLLDRLGDLDPIRWPEICGAVAHVIAC